MTTRTATELVAAWRAAGSDYENATRDHDGDAQADAINRRGALVRELTDRGLGHIRTLLRHERRARIAYKGTVGDVSPGTLTERLAVLQAWDGARQATDAAVAEVEQQAMVDAAVHLAEQLLEADVDHFGMVEGMARLLTPDAWPVFAEAIGACTVHLCDVEICADDADELAGECPTSQQAKASAAGPLRARCTPCQTWHEFRDDAHRQAAEDEHRALYGHGFDVDPAGGE
jgi:hypothetical protein